MSFTNDSQSPLIREPVKGDPPFVHMTIETTYAWKNLGGKSVLLFFCTNTPKSRIPNRIRTTSTVFKVDLRHYARLRPITAQLPDLHKSRRTIRQRHKLITKRARRYRVSCPTAARCRIQEQLGGNGTVAG